MNELAGVFDLHVHAGPDVRPRKMTSLELARAAHSAGMRGLLLKNHHSSTVAQAASIREATPGLEVFGGLVLNESVGGLNPAAVEAALRMGAAEIWLPTLSSANERAYRDHPGEGICVLDEQEHLLKPVWEILELMAAGEAILGLGHLSPKEMVAVIKAARQLGLKKLLVNHPEIDFLNLSLAAQREMAGPGVFFERCYARKGFALNWDGLAEVIRQLGVASTVLATDLGQPENPDPITGMRTMLIELAKRGFTRQELETMVCRNPASLLGVSP